MMKWVFLSTLICSTFFSKSQIFNNSTTNISVGYIPSSQCTSTSNIAAYVTKNFNSNKQKVSAIYLWVTSNIKYDTDSADLINLGIDGEAKVTAAFRRRRGVCENFAAIFNDICLKAGFTSFIVDGYTKQNGTVDKTGHTWCAVMVDNKWELFDPTWDASAGTDTKFFMIPPEDMIESHIPYDPMWQLLHHPVTNQQFYSGNYSIRKDQPDFNYADTIAGYIKMDSLQKFRSTAYRTEQNGVTNNLVKYSVASAKMNVEMIRQDKDVNLYNSAVADLNEVMSTYNNFIQYRNKQFVPAVSNAELRTMLNGADEKILQAHKKLDEIEKSEATFQIGTQEVRNKLITITNKINEQKDFINLYINTATANRPSLFYTKQVSKTGK